MAVGGCPAPISVPCDIWFWVFDRVFRHRLNFPGLGGCDGSVDIDGKEVTISQTVIRGQGRIAPPFYNREKRTGYIELSKRGELPCR